MAHSADDVDDADRRTRALYFFLYMYCDSPLRDSRSLEGPCRPSPCLCAYVCECVELIERQREREKKRSGRTVDIVDHGPGTGHTREIVNSC